MHIQPTVSGITIEGHWEDVCAGAREVETVIEEEGHDTQEHKQWRPKEDETEQEIKQKTVEVNKVDPKTIKTKPIRMIAKMFRKLEHVVYNKALLVNPYYIDTHVFSANLRRKRDIYVLKYNFRDNSMKTITEDKLT